MGFIDDELQEVRKLCENVIPSSKLVSCVRAMVRVEIRKTFTKTLVVCLQFPENYPSSLILIELKSKNLHQKLLNKLTYACEEHIKLYLGKAQILHTLRFFSNFLDDNPLCACFEEISEIKKLLVDADDLKLKQKTSTVQLKLKEGKYYVCSKFIVPDDYPKQSISVEADTNFPPSIERFLLGQAKETVRKCVEPPLRLPANKTFTPSPSLLSASRLFIDALRTLPKQYCQLCHEPGLPEDPQEVEGDESADKHIERLYCNHLFHLECFLTFMKTPPFQGGKHCPTCGERIYHNKWRLTEKLAEDRWAHQEARRRELEDVAMAFL